MNNFELERLTLSREDKLQKELKETKLREQKLNDLNEQILKQLKVIVRINEMRSIQINKKIEIIKTLSLFYYILLLIQTIIMVTTFIIY